MTPVQENLICVGLPLYQGYIHFDCNVSIGKMMQECAEHGFVLEQYYAKGPSLPIKRRQCIDHARKIGAKWLLMVDSDMVIPNPRALYLMLSRKKKVISAVYYAKQSPWIPILGRYKDRDYVPKPDESIEFWMREVAYEQCFNLPKDSIVEVDAVGGGFVLVETSCFDKMTEPYFLLTDYHGLGEDYFMCHKLRQLGYKIHVDTSIQLGHIGDYTYTEVDHRIGQHLISKKVQEANDQSGVCQQLPVPS